MLALIVLSWIFGGLVVAAAVYWIGVLHRVVITRVGDWSVRRGLDHAVADHQLVSIVIPAHNEEAVIGECVASLRRQTHERIEIIFVLDRCTDGTADVLRPHVEADERVTVIELDACPDDWAGKCHAAHQGARVARGEWLIFSDADTIFDADLVKAAVGHSQASDLALLSLLSDLTHDADFERHYQPAAVSQLLYLFPLKRMNAPTADRRRPFANGQFLLFRRDWYERVGGHEAVRDHLLEDIAFARRVHEADGVTNVLLADGMLTCRMYDTLSAFREGWKRIYIEAVQRSVTRLRRQARRCYALAVVSPVVHLSALLIGLLLFVHSAPIRAAILFGLVTLSIVVRKLALLRMYALAGAPLWSVLLYLRAFWLIGSILAEGADDLALGRPIRWAGREYILTPR